MTGHIERSHTVAETPPTHATEPQGARGAEKRAGIRARRSDAPTASEGRALLDAAISERDFQQQVIDLARLNGFLAYHTFDSRRSEPGFPDLVAARGDRIVFAELKAEGGKVSKEQWQWLEALLAAGAEVWIWRPHDWDLIEQTLR